MDAAEAAGKAVVALWLVIGFSVDMTASMNRIPVIENSIKILYNKIICLFSCFRHQLLSSSTVG
jgi:hypothetical protein